MSKETPLSKDNPLSKGKPPFQRKKTHPGQSGLQLLQAPGAKVLAFERLMDTPQLVAKSCEGPWRSCPFGALVDETTKTGPPGSRNRHLPSDQPKCTPTWGFGQVSKSLALYACFLLSSPKRTPPPSQKQAPPAVTFNESCTAAGLERNLWISSRGNYFVLLLFNQGLNDTDGFGSSKATKNYVWVVLSANPVVAHICGFRFGQMQIPHIRYIRHQETLMRETQGNPRSGSCFKGKQRETTLFGVGPPDLRG